MTGNIVPRSEWRVLSAAPDDRVHPWWFETLWAEDREQWIVILQTQIAAVSGPCWTVQSVTVETEEQATEVKDHLRSCIDPCHSGYEVPVARGDVCPSSPLDPVYWAMDPTWRLFDVPDRAARRLARRAADLMQRTYQAGDDTVSLDEVIAWASVASVTDDGSALWGETHLPTPAEVKTRLGLTVDLAPAQVAAATWRVEQLLIQGWSTGTRPLITDICQTATRTRVRALSRWFAGGRRLADLNVEIPQQETGTDRIYPHDLAWLACELPPEYIADWQAVLAELRLAETIDNVAGLAPLWLDGISPQTTLSWHRALGDRSAEIGVWRDVVRPLIMYGVEPCDLVAWLDHHENDTVMDRVDAILEVASDGWMSITVRDIPWAVREQYRTTYRGIGADHPGQGMSPHIAAHVWFPLRQSNQARHDQVLEVLDFRLNGSADDETTAESAA